MITIIIIINLIYTAILTALRIVVKYIQMQYMHIGTCMKQSYSYTHLHVYTYTHTPTHVQILYRHINKICDLCTKTLGPLRSSQQEQKIPLWSLFQSCIVQRGPELSPCRTAVNGLRFVGPRVTSSRCCLLACLLNVQATYELYLRDGSAQTIVRAATPRYELQIELSISSIHGILAPGRPFPALSLQRQAPGPVCTTR